MKKYNKIYFLHIPKTGGRFLSKYILEPIQNTLEQNNIKTISLPSNIHKHGGWYKDIDDETYVITIFRDPVEFFISALAHMISDEVGLIDKNNNFILKHNGASLEIEKYQIYKALSEFTYLKDFQSQNFILEPSIGNTIYESRVKHKDNFIINKELVYKRIKRTNLMLRHKDLKNMNYYDLVNKISSDLGVDIKINLGETDSLTFKNYASESLFNKLSQEEKDYIYNHFMFDKEIYYNDSLFWNPSSSK